MTCVRLTTQGFVKGVKGQSRNSSPTYDIQGLLQVLIHSPRYLSSPSSDSYDAPIIQGFIAHSREPPSQCCHIRLQLRFSDLTLDYMHHCCLEQSQDCGSRQWYNIRAEWRSSVANSTSVDSLLCAVVSHAGDAQIETVHFFCRLATLYMPIIDFDLSSPEKEDTVGIPVTKRGYVMIVFRSLHPLLLLSSILGTVI